VQRGPCWWPTGASSAVGFGTEISVTPFLHTEVMTDTTDEVQSASPPRISLGLCIVKPLVVWDADDTLWAVELLYDEVRTEIAEYLAAIGIEARAWDAKQRQVDLQNVGRFGLSRERFPSSCVEAYDALSGVNGREAIRRTIRRLAENVFARPAPLAAGAAEALEAMSRLARQVLLTKGDHEVQEARIRRSGLAGHFEEVHIVEEKTATVFRTVLDHSHTEPAAAWSIGNSLPSDINPALEVGMSAIWIDAPVWIHERRERAVAPGQVHVATSLREAVDLVRSATRSIYLS